MMVLLPRKVHLFVTLIGGKGAVRADPGHLEGSTVDFCLLLFCEQLDRVCLKFFTQFISLKGRH